MPITIRPYQEGDSTPRLTKLLNEAYAGLAAQGLRYVASWQTEDMTLDRINRGTCLVAFDGEEIVGTVMVYPPETFSECEIYRQPGVYHFGKFGVDPNRKGQGIGKMLYLAAEQLAREQGATIFGCDTAEQATHLIDLYHHWGFEIVQKFDWSMTNYISVVLTKRL